MGSAGRLGEGITKLTNCRLLRGDELVVDDVWISSTTGRILRSQAAFYDDLTLPDRTIDLGGRIVSPGFIDCQLNGAFGFNFSTVFEDMSQYESNLRDLNSKLVETGVTSYIPTVTSQTGDLYKAVCGCPGPPSLISSYILRFFRTSAHQGSHETPVRAPNLLGLMLKGPFSIQIAMASTMSAYSVRRPR